MTPLAPGGGGTCSILEYVRGDNREDLELDEADVRDEDEALIPRETIAGARGAAVAAWRVVAGAARRRRALVAALLAYVALAFLLRPAMPFEWDEVLFQRALDDYNVARHSPHPPGYPVYVAVARAARAVVGDPLLALQLAGLAAAAAALALVFSLTRRLGGSPAAAAAAVAVVAATPTFVFHANVGLSDGMSAAAGAAAMAALLAAAERGAALPWAAVVVALALGVRPQLLPLLLPLGVVAVVQAARRHEWRRLAAAAVAGLVVTDVIWLSAMYATGSGFWAAWQDHARTLATAERTARLPGARLAELVPYWFVRGFGSPVLAGAFWTLVALGTAAWLKVGRRRLAAACLASAALYLTAGVFTMNYTTGVRYLLPALPALGVLAAGVVSLPWRAARRAAGAVVAAWCLAAAWWAAPVLALRRAPAPTWAALEWARDHLDPSRTTVVFDGFFEPHVQYVLAPEGFTLAKFEPGTAYGAWQRPGGRVVYVCPRPVAGGEVLFAARWDSAKLRWLTRNRYDEAAVTAAPPPGEPVFSPEWRVRESDWELWGTGAVCLDELSAPRLALLEAGDNPLRVRRAGMPALTVRPGAPIEATLLPGAAGCLLVNGPGGVHSHMPPVRTFPLRASAARDEATLAAVLPLVAGGVEAAGGVWTSDLAIHNVGAAPLALSARFLPTGRDNGAAPEVEFTLPAAGRAALRDVLAGAGLTRFGSLGALLVYAADPGAGCAGGGCGFTMFSQTYNSRAPRLGPRLGEGLPAIPARSGLYGGGRATFDGVSNDDAVTGWVSVATWIPAPVRARLTLRGPDKREVGASEVDVPPFGHVFAPFPGRTTGGQLAVQLVKPPAQALFYPAVTLIAAATGEPTHLLATPSKKTAPPEWLASRPAPLPAAGPAARRR